MPIRFLLALLLALCALPLEARASELLRAIDREAATGALTEAERQWLRVASVTAPHRLPEPWRTIHARESSGTGRTCHTPLLVEAFQALPGLDPPGRAALRGLFAPPNDLAHVIETTTPYPIRVSYAESYQQPQAERLLAAAVRSYQHIVDELGFWPPPIEPGVDFYRFYLRDAGLAAGYTAPYDENDATDHYDAFSYIVIDPELDDLALEITVAHEFTHAAQAGMDAAEVVGFWENTATVIESDVYPIGWPYTTGMFGYFQAQPYRALEYMNMSESDLYEYGGALFAHFLREQYGNGDAVLLRQLWEGSVQRGWVNEPDYFDVLDDLLEEEGGMRAVARAFAEHRYFVGDDDDGAHLAGAEEWGGAEVWMSGSLGVSQLPIVDRGPYSEETKPQPNGCNYFGMSTFDAHLPLRFSMLGLGGLDWDAQVFAIPSEGAAVRYDLSVDAAGAGAVSVPIEGTRRLVLAICQLAPAGYDPDEREWPRGDYRFRVELDVPPPAVTAVEPSELTQGAHGQELIVRGSGFHPGAGLAVRAEGGRVLLELLERVSGSELRVRAAVAPDAPLGPRDVIVSNPGGAEATGAELLRIVEPGVAVGPAPTGADDGGCDCRTARPAAARWGWGPVASAIALGLTLGVRRRRDRCTTPGSTRSRARRRRPVGALAAAVGWLVLLGAARADAQPAWDAALSSSSLPIRVHFPGSVPVATAEDILRYAEQAWTIQVDQMGFTPPTAVDAEGNRVAGLHVYLDPDADDNHTVPEGENPDTPFTDCTVHVVVSTNGSGSTLPWLVAHEANHAFQMAADCAESDFAYENTTCAVSVLSSEEEPLFADYFLPTFQQNPQRGLDCAFFASEPLYYYHYGAALFGLFLEDAYGDYDGRLLASLWQATRQEGTVISVGSSGTRIDVPNEPDLLDAVGLVLPEVGLEGALVEFARWRYFVGIRDDGAHFRDGATWIDREVVLDRFVEVTDLPLLDAEPSSPPNELGTSYAEIGLAGATERNTLRVGFEGDGAVRWHVDLLLVGAGRPTEVQTIALPDDRSGELLVSALTDFDRAVLVVTNLGTADHDADETHCSVTYPFRYRLERLDSSLAPVVAAVDPATIERGRTSYVWIDGEHFDDGVTAALDGEGIVIAWTDRVDDTLIGLELAVDAEAPLGPRTLTLTNPTGQAVTEPEAVTIVAPERAARAPGLHATGGCLCTMHGPRHARAAGVALVASFALLVALGGRRAPRRRAGRGRPPARSGDRQTQATRVAGGPS